jgi:hypothetical protein
LPDISYYIQHPKRGKIYLITKKIYGLNIYQMAMKYTKWPWNIPNGHEIYQMAMKYTKWPRN